MHTALSHPASLGGWGAAGSGGSTARGPAGTLILPLPRRTCLALPQPPLLPAGQGQQQPHTVAALAPGRKSRLCRRNSQKLEEEAGPGLEVTLSCHTAGSEAGRPWRTTGVKLAKNSQGPVGAGGLRKRFASTILPTPMPPSVAQLGLGVCLLVFRTRTAPLAVDQLGRPKTLDHRTLEEMANTPGLYYALSVALLHDLVLVPSLHRIMFQS